MSDLPPLEKADLEWRVIHRAETYKSLITISLEVFKYLALLNGGAAAGMLSGYGGLIALIGLSAYRESLTIFAVGLAFSGAAIILSWLSQYVLHNENIGRHRKEGHPWVLWTAFTCVVLSFLCFTTGAIHAAQKVHAVIGTSRV